MIGFLSVIAAGVAAVIDTAVGVWGAMKITGRFVRRHEHHTSKLDPNGEDADWSL